MDTESVKDTSVFNYNQLRKGQKIIYEGKEAEVIEIDPLLTIKIKDAFTNTILENALVPLLRPSKNNEIKTAH